MRRFFGLIIQFIGCCRLPMGLRLMRLLARMSPTALVDLCSESQGRKFTYRIALDTVFGIDLAFNKSLEPELDELARTLVNPESIVIDAGCNVGTFCIPLAPLVARIIAIDANPEMVRQAQVNVGLNKLPNVEFVAAALGSSVGCVSFYVSDQRNEISSLSREWLLQQHATARKLTVPMLTLMTLINDMQITKVDLLKIDVENFSGAVLKGLEGGLSKVCHILAEDSDDISAVIPWLVDSGFTARQPFKDRPDIPLHTKQTWLFSGPATASV